MSPGLGAVARFAPGFGASAATRVHAESPVEERSLSLLLLEDDDALRQMLVWELSELAYRVHPVKCCSDARAAIADRDFDLALMDVGLPDGDGAALATDLTAQKPSLRIVLCSGRPGALDLENVPAAVIARLYKPVSVRRLDELFRGRK